MDKLNKYAHGDPIIKDKINELIDWINKHEKNHPRKPIVFKH